MYIQPHPLLISSNENEFENLSGNEDLEQVMEQFEFEVQNIKHLEKSFLPVSPPPKMNFLQHSIEGSLKTQINVSPISLQTQRNTEKSQNQVRATERKIASQSITKPNQDLSCLPSLTGNVYPSFLNQFYYLGHNVEKCNQWSFHQLLVAREKLLLVSREKFVYSDARDSFVVQVWQNIFSFSGLETFLSFLQSQLQSHSVLLKEVQTAREQQNKSSLAKKRFPKLDLSKLSINKKEKATQKKEEEKKKMDTGKKDLPFPRCLSIIYLRSKERSIVCGKENPTKHWRMVDTNFNSWRETERERKEKRTFHLLFHFVWSLWNWEKNVSFSMFKGIWLGNTSPNSSRMGLMEQNQKQLEVRLRRNLIVYFFCF